jgi:hypothetical protein
MSARAVNGLAIRVVRGQPDDEEHAAVVAAVEAVLRHIRESLASDPRSRARAPWGRGSRTRYLSPRSWKSQLSRTDDR